MEYSLTNKSSLMIILKKQQVNQNPKLQHLIFKDSLGFISTLNVVSHIMVSTTACPQPLPKHLSLGWADHQRYSTQILSDPYFALCDKVLVARVMNREKNMIWV